MKNVEKTLGQNPATHLPYTWVAHDPGCYTGAIYSIGDGTIVTIEHTEGGYKAKIPQDDFYPAGLQRQLHQAWSQTLSNQLQKLGKTVFVLSTIFTISLTGFELLQTAGQNTHSLSLEETLVAGPVLGAVFTLAFFIQNDGLSRLMKTIPTRPKNQHMEQLDTYIKHVLGTKPNFKGRVQ